MTEHMVITELYIKNFGMLSEKHIRFTDGVQVIYGENESGKSTLHGFIRAMFFGLERGRGKAALKDDFTRYEPWDNPGNYAGVLWFLCGGKQFRLERNFDRYTKRTSLVCETDGEELSVEHGDLEMLLGGMTASLYDSTVSIGQLAAAPGQELSRALENYAVSFCETGGADIDVNGALKCLKERQREAEKALQKEKERREEKRRKLLQECAYLEQDMTALQEEYRGKETILAGLQAETGIEEKAPEDHRIAEEQKRPKRREDSEIPGRAEEPGRAGKFLAGGAAGVCVGLLGSIWSQVMSRWQQTGSGSAFLILSGVILLIGAGLLAAGGYIFFTTDRKKRKYDENNIYISDRGASDNQKIDPGQFAQESKEPGKQERNYQNSEKIRRIRWEMERIRAEWKEKEIRCSNLREQSREEEPGDTEKRLAGRCRALQTAMEQIRLAADRLGRQTAGSLNKRASEIFAALTDGRYGSMEIGGKLQISVWDGSRRIPAERLSRGTLEQIYFSVRMAAAEILQEEPMPVILDETFVFYDEKRLKSALKWLRGQNRQVIILSCNRREKEILKQF